MLGPIRGAVADMVRSAGGWRVIAGQLAVHAGAALVAKEVGELGEEVERLTEFRDATVRDLRAAQDELQRTNDRTHIDRRAAAIEHVAAGYVDADVLLRAATIERTLRGDDQAPHCGRLMEGWTARNDGAPADPPGTDCGALECGDRGHVCAVPAAAE